MIVEQRRLSEFLYTAPPTEKLKTRRIDAVGQLLAQRTSAFRALAILVGEAADQAPTRKQRTTAV